MLIISKSKSNWRWFRSTTLAVCGAAIAILIPSILKAGTGGVPGGCAFTKTVNGKVQYLPCTGVNLQMWYSASSPTYNQGDMPCGQYGNQNCGAVTGDPMSE